MSHRTSHSLCLKQHRLPPPPEPPASWLSPPRGQRSQSQKLGVTLTPCSSPLPVTPLHQLQSHSYPTVPPAPPSSSCPLPPRPRFTAPGTHPVKPHFIGSLPCLNSFWGSPMPSAKPTRLGAQHATPCAHQAHSPTHQVGAWQLSPLCLTSLPQRWGGTVRGKLLGRGRCTWVFSDHRQVVSPSTWDSVFPTLGGVLPRTGPMVSPRS